MAGLNNEGGIDVGGYHLKIHIPADTFATQDGLSWEYAMNDCHRFRVVVLRRDPISDTRQVPCGLNIESESPGEFGRDFPPRRSDEIAAPVHGRDPSNRVSR
jgi:hypothetical protein